MAYTPGLQWAPEARARMQRIPSFARGLVTKRVEDYARKNGISFITPALLSDIRQSMPVDFSKRRPFFMKGDSS